MSEISESLVRDILQKDNYIKIVFRQSIISEHEAIYKILTRAKPEFGCLHDLKFEHATLTVGGYDTGNGFQYILLAKSIPNVGKRFYLKGNEYPRTLKSEEIISELRFSFREKTKGQPATKFRMRFVNNFVEIHPKPPPAIVNEIVSALKEAILTNALVFLSSAREKIRAAKSDFLKGRYREAMHNIYYAMHNATKSLQARKGEGTYLDHKNMGKSIDRVLGQLQQESTDFQRLNLDEYSSIAEEARKSRELADYGIGFEAGGSEKQLARMLYEAEELVTLSDYAINNWITQINGKLNLHFSREQEETFILNDFLDEVHPGNYFVVRSLLVLADSFNATAFAYHLLCERDLYYTDMSSYFFQGGHYARYKNGTLTHRVGPKKGFVELTRENIKKWSAIVKPRALKELATSKEDKIQNFRLFFRNCFLEMYIFPDGRLYVISELDECNFHSQLVTFDDFEQIIKKFIERNYPINSVLSLPIELLKRKAI